VTTQVAKYPKTGKGKAMTEPGNDLWKTFRPCYIRAFKDAADYAKDDGKVSEGRREGGREWPQLPVGLAV
jgi:hypothetical protein